MIKYLSVSRLPGYFRCPYCSPQLNTKLNASNKELLCPNCKRKYPIKNNIVQFVISKDLDKETKRELKGNSFSLSKKNIEHFANKDVWSNYYNHFANQKINYLIAYLNSIRPKGIVSLGSGTGFELKEILKRKHINLIFSSDLAFAATSVVPVTLRGLNLKICLFTSDLNHVPVRPNDSLPILIYEALHHTRDIHSTIEKLLQKKYKNIFFIEPCTNFIIKILAKYNLAQRVEYSGLKPDFLDIGILKKLSKKYEYKLKIRTLWDIPEDYIRIICKKDSLLQTILLKFIDIFSWTGNLFHFGSFAVVSLERSR
ncbi:MAG: hypothetical protein UT21_C0009G0004 [Candidatus Woesebacteria bacterium GW2011_GWA1_39_11b]|nr:MAG: hypothetical protein UT21_C0009G0004 [Candidatus Woesebacteria bacterium GW2011_GWA1_39_11b]KKS76861.1 MAG: hypothetical protein UV51_C0014G0002 [Candidatus Woesebacteria bacterium GW2011_GWC1_42_9]